MNILKIVTLLILTLLLASCGGGGEEASDTTAPVITLTGDATVSVAKGSSYTDAGATATDDFDGSVAVVTTGTVDTSTTGSYVLRYSATDSEGNAATEVTRTVSVIGTLNDTGITFGGDYGSGNNTGCSGETIAEQDCSHGRDATNNDDSDGHAGFNFTKLDASGEPLVDQTQDYATNAWVCIRDNNTGLIWEVKTDAGIHDKDNIYEWDDWDTLVDGSNGASFCGFSDWRVANIEELHSILNLNRRVPAIDTAYFPNTESTYYSYWSSSPYANDVSLAWIVSFNDGIDAGNSRSNSGYVRLVRSVQ